MKNGERLLIDRVFFDRVGILLTISFDGLWSFTSVGGSKMYHLIDLSVIEIKESEHSLSALQFVFLGLMLVITDRSFVRPIQPEEQSDEIHSQN